MNRRPASALTLLIAIGATLALSGCGYAISPYGVSSKNVFSLKNSGVRPVAVPPFTATEPGQNSITCRAAGPVQTPGKESFETYIHDAFVEELQLASLAEPQSPIVLRGVLKKVDFSSSIGSGRWLFTLAMSSNRSSGFEVNSSYEFSTNWVADKACQQVAQAFGPAVQKLIADTVAHPGFKALAR